MSPCGIAGYSLTNSPFAVFGSPSLLKRKADGNDVDAPPASQSAPLSPRKRPQRDSQVLDRMWELMRVGGQHLDSLRVSQLAAQQASGTMAAAMLWQQGAMREVAVWELEVEDTMREMARIVAEEDSDL